MFNTRKMHPDSMTDTRSAAEARYTLKEQEQMKARRQEKLSRRRGLPNYNTQPGPGPGPCPKQSLQWKHFDTEADSIKFEHENEGLSFEHQDITFLTKAKFSGKMNLAQLHKRHDDLEAYIKQMKEDIAKHPKTLEKEAARKKEENLKEYVRQEVSSEDDDEMGFDIKLE